MFYDPRFTQNIVDSIFLMFTIHFLQNVLLYRCVTTKKISDELTFLQKMECKIDFTVF